MKLFVLAFGGYACGSAANAVVGSLEGGAPQEAAAQEAGSPSVYTETCSLAYTVGTYGYYYAEHAFPGRSASDLAQVTAVLTLTPMVGAPPNYHQVTANVFVRDGYAAVSCGSQAGPTASSVSFVLP